ncbi:MAG: coproporphyrinogen III oxidase, partial [Flavobacteriaceae bacterium]
GNGQRGFKDEDLPKDFEKREMYEKGKLLLEEKGYIEVGMDHFALPTDSLFKASENGKLHRNFMGYNSSKTQLMIGLGVSSISDSLYGFAQNEKHIETYYELLKDDKIPVVKGHILTQEDLLIRKHIQHLMCQFYTSWDTEADYFEELPQVLESLNEMQKDGLIKIHPKSITITQQGKPFVRNVCMAFDLRLKRKTQQTRLFSLSV